MTHHSERIYFRHVREGQRGYKVTRDGREYIRLDRPAEEILLPFRESEWLLDRETRPLNKWLVARVAFEADKVLCEGLGEHPESRREWASVVEDKRIAWMAHGPPPGPRKELFDAIMKVTRKYTVA